MANARKKETGFDKLARQMERGFSSVADDIGELRTELTDFRKEVNQQFELVKKDIRDIRTELVDIHRRLDRLEEQGASSAGFSKEIDIILGRVSVIEKRLGIKHATSK
jgi:uncharacterized coiled-coil DUF342 family protein